MSAAKKNRFGKLAYIPLLFFISQYLRPNWLNRCLRRRTVSFQTSLNHQCDSKLMAITKFRDPYGRRAREDNSGINGSFTFHAKPLLTSSYFTYIGFYRYPSSAFFPAIYPFRSHFNAFHTWTDGIVGFFVLLIGMVIAFPSTSSSVIALVGGFAAPVGQHHFGCVSFTLLCVRGVSL